MALIIKLHNKQDVSASNVSSIPEEKWVDQNNAPVVIKSEGKYYLTDRVEGGQLVYKETTFVNLDAQ